MKKYLAHTMPESISCRCCLGLMLVSLILHSQSVHAEEHRGENLETNQYLLIIGEVEAQKVVTWVKPSDPSQVSILEKGHVRIRVNAGVSYVMLELSKCNIFEMSDTNVTSTSQVNKVALMVKPSSRALPKHGVYLFYGKQYCAPEGLIKKHSLEGIVLLKARERKEGWMFKEGTQRFMDELNKYGINWPDPQQWQADQSGKTN